MAGRVVLLEDDEGLRNVLVRALRKAGYEVRATASPQTVETWLRRGEADLLLADVLLDGENFITRLPQVMRLQKDLPVILMSAQSTARTAIGAERERVFDYLPKPFDLNHMIDRVGAALAPLNLKQSEQTETFGLIGRAPAMQDSFRALGRAIRGRSHVLIIGESGVGKQLSADLVLAERGYPKDQIQRLTRTHKPQQVFDLVQAGGPMIVLRLDRWSEEGASALLDGLDCSASAEVIATARSLEFDPALALRLGECRIELPPLRQRREDIPEIARAIARQYVSEQGLRGALLSEAALTRLQQGVWPGNIAQLRTVVARAVLESGQDHVSAEQVEELLREAPIEVSSEDQVFDRAAATALAAGVSRQASLDELDRALIRAALHNCGGNKSKAAEKLGMNRNTLARRLSDLGLDID
ncbi:response regulator [Maricaulis sp.]|uniref:sigma-54-dependent transcriptional regulator n=1 Tax=Maricaulis sp. TaxID=1486257 RepID=UPI00260CB04D|nr:response regulator [Maricaulis sp.]